MGKKPAGKALVWKAGCIESGYAAMYVHGSTCLNLNLSESDAWAEACEGGLLPAATSGEEHSAAAWGQFQGHYGAEASDCSTMLPATCTMPGGSACLL